MTAYPQTNAVALHRGPLGQKQMVATQVNNDGDVVQLAEGIFGVVRGLAGGNGAIAIGDPVEFSTIGVYAVLCAATTDTYADGAAVYFDTVNNYATTTGSATCLYLGTACGAKTTGSKRVRVTLNGNIAPSLAGAATATTLNVSGASTLTGAVAMGDAASVGTTLSVAGVTTLGSSLTVSVNAVAYTATASTFTVLGTTYDTMELAGVTGQAAYGWKLGAAGAPGQTLLLVETAGYPGRLYPYAGGTINGLTAGTGYITITAGHMYLCRCTAANTWFVADLGAYPTA